jgi:serine/threonine-protein kinase
VRLDELIAMLQTSPHEQDVYRLFGACRSGFHDALSVWPENDAAKRGLVDAVAAVAKYELDRGKPQAAVSLLGELREPHPLLDQARLVASQQTERVAELERIGRDHDKAIGTRTRAMLVASGVIRVGRTASAARPSVRVIVIYCPF